MTVNQERKNDILSTRLVLRSAPVAASISKNRQVNTTCSFIHAKIRCQPSSRWLFLMTFWTFLVRHCSKGIIYIAYTRVAGYCFLNSIKSSDSPINAPTLDAADLFLSDSHRWISIAPSTWSVDMYFYYYDVINFPRRALWRWQDDKGLQHSLQAARQLQKQGRLRFS